MLIEKARDSMSNTKVVQEPIEGLNDFLQFIRDDYCKWSAGSPTETRDKFNQAFCEGLQFQVGSKYIKVIKSSYGGDRSVHSFIVKNDTAKFKKGDILKANSWNAPATNFARGNVIAKKYGQTQWTGAM